MTEKLYYQDSFTKIFTAVVTSCVQEKTAWAITLNRTAFYPEGGGQPADHGSLGSASVIDTREKNGEIIHFCDKPLPIGETVEGTIDFARRFDFMQQHSGEHIVSGILCEKFHCDNVGFHIGHDLVTIDFNAELSTEDVEIVEKLANQYIWEDHPIQISYPSSTELENLEYRSKKALTGQVRIVSWPGADCCTCCGTHMKTSGQVGVIKLISCQKFRDGVRIEMAAGNRALRWINTIAGQNTKVSQLLSAKPDATASAVERLQKELYTLRGRVTELEERDFVRLAEEHAGKGNVLLFQSAMAADSLRKLCGAVQDKCGGRCAVFAGEDGAYQYVISQPGGNLRSFGKDLNAALHGRGGGKPEFIQGSVQAARQEIESFLIEE